MTAPIVNLINLQAKVQDVANLLNHIRTQTSYMTYETLCEIEQKLQEFAKKPETAAPARTIELLLPGVQQTILKKAPPVFVEKLDWRAELPYVVYRAIAVQRGDTGNIDEWMRNLIANHDEEVKLLNSTFGDLFLDTADIEEIVDAALTLIRKHTNTVTSTFYFKTEVQESMLDPQLSVEELIDSIKTHGP